MKIRIAIVDDHPVFRTGLKGLLEQEEDLEVVAECGEGWEAVKTVTENDVDVLVLDLAMPGLPGARVAEIALRNKPRLAIVVLSMHEDEHYVQDLFKIGVRGYVFKKSTGTELLQAIRTAYRGERYLDPSLVGKAISSFVGLPPPSRGSSRLDLLTPREREVCRLLAYGHTNGEIARKLSISERTVQTHRRNIMAKLGLSGRAELVSFAIDHGLFNAGS